VSSSDYSTVKRLVQVLEYLYKTSCLTLAFIGLVKLAVNNGSWVNYAIIVIAQLTLLFALKWTFSEAKNRDSTEQ
jgi:hypothetical protein